MSKSKYTEARGVLSQFYSKLISWLYNLILKLFKGNIKNSIQKELTDTVTDIINTKLNQFIQQIPLSHAIGTWGKIDYSLSENPVVNGNGASFPLKAVVESASGVAPPFGPTTALPTFAAGTSMVEVRRSLFAQLTVATRSLLAISPVTALSTPLTRLASGIWSLLMRICQPPSHSSSTLTPFSVCRSL